MITRTTPLLLALCLVPMGWSACGKKPAEPTPRAGTVTSPAPGPAPQRPGPTQPAPPPDKTVGGVSLIGLPAELARAADLLATRRNQAVQQLLADPAAAKAVGARLLASKNLEEIIGGLQIAAQAGGDAGAVAALLGHDAPRVRVAASRTVVALDSEPVRAAARSALGRPVPHTRVAAAHTLGALRDQGALGALVSALDDADPAVVDAAAHALSRLNTESVAKELLAAVGDPDASAAHRLPRLVALRGAATVPSDTALSALLGDKALRRAAARLIRTPGPAAERAVAHDDPDVRLAVVEALGARPLDAVWRERLAERAHKDADPAVQAAAVTALARTAGPDEVAVLTALSSKGKAPTVVRAALARLAVANDAAGATAALLAVDVGPAPAPTQRVWLSALARRDTRATWSRLIATLANPALGKRAHLALVEASGRRDLGLDASAWRTWLNARHPAPATDVSAPATPPK